MKGTYDIKGLSYQIRFDCSEYAKKKHQETGYIVPKDVSFPFYECDGLSTIYTMERLNADFFSILVTNPVEKAASKQSSTNTNYEIFLPLINKPQEEESIEYTVAKSISDNYSTMSDYQKKLALCFLERYVFSYEEVREIQKNCVVDLSSVDKKFGSSGKAR